MLHGSVQLVGCHASGEGRADVLSNARADLESLAPASKAATNTGALALCCGRVLHVVGTGLAKGKGLGLEKLWARLDPGHAALAGLFVALVVHLDIVLGVAFARLLAVEAAVATVQDVHLGEGKAGVVFHVDVAVVATDELGGKRCTVDGVFAVEDQESVRRVGTFFKEFLGQELLVVKVEGAFDVATVVFVFKSAVDDDDLLVLVVVLGVEDVVHGFLGDARESVGVVVVHEVGKLEGALLVLHGRSKAGSRGHVEVLLLLLHDIVGVLEHAERAANLLAGRAAEGLTAAVGLADVADAWRARVAADSSSRGSAACREH